MSPYKQSILLTTMFPALSAPQLPTLFWYGFHSKDDHPALAYEHCNVLMLNQLSITPWRCIGEWRYSSTILDLNTILRGQLHSLATYFERAPSTHSIRWLDTRADSNVVNEKKNPLPMLGIEPRPSSTKLVTTLSDLTESAHILRPNRFYFKKHKNIIIINK
jgi:hypothetical protein